MCDLLNIIFHVRRAGRGSKTLKGLTIDGKICRHFERFFFPSKLTSLDHFITKVKSNFPEYLKSLTASFFCPNKEDFGHTPPAAGPLCPKTKLWNLSSLVSGSCDSFHAFELKTIISWPLLCHSYMVLSDYPIEQEGCLGADSTVGRQRPPASGV